MNWLAEPGFDVLRKPYEMSDLQPLLTHQKVHGTVLVENGSGDHDDLDNMLAAADEYPEILGVVGWVDTAGDPTGVRVQIDRAFAHPLADRWLKGLRIQAQSEAADHLELPAARAAATALAERTKVLEIVCRPAHLAGAATLARQLPGCRIVLDHAGKPDIAGHTPESFDQWRAAIADLACAPNTYVKVSGLVTEARWHNWSVDDLKPYVATVVEHFGARRVMVGSDWPACLLAADYHAVMAAARDCLTASSLDDRQWMFGRTAVTIYGLQT